MDLIDQDAHVGDHDNEEVEAIPVAGEIPARMEGVNLCRALDPCPRIATSLKRSIPNVLREATAIIKTPELSLQR